MPAVYPTAEVTFTEKEDGIDIVDDEHMNKVQREIKITQHIIGTNPQGTKATLNERMFGVVGLDGTLRQGSVFPTGASLYGSGQGFYRNDENVYYIYNGATWDAQGQTLSNLAFSYAGAIGTNQFSGVIMSTGIIVGSTNLQNLFWAVAKGTMAPIIKSKFIRLAGFSTLTTRGHIWHNSAQADAYPVLEVDIGGVASGTARGLAAGANTVPLWADFALSLTGLDVGTVYDLTISMKNANIADTSIMTYVSSIIGHLS